MYIQPVELQLLASSCFEGRRGRASTQNLRQCVLFMRALVSALCCVINSHLTLSHIKAAIVNAVVAFLSLYHGCCYFCNNNLPVGAAIIFFTEPKTRNSLARAVSLLRALCW